MNTFINYVMDEGETTQEQKVSTLQTIKDWIDHLIQSIKNFISGNKNKQLGYEYAESLGLTSQELESISRMLTGVLDTARENLAKQTKAESKVSGEETVAHSVDVFAKEGKIFIPEEYTEDYLKSGDRKNKNRLKSYNEGKRITVKNHEELIDFLNGSDDFADTVAVGVVSNLIAEDIYEKSNGVIDAEGYFWELENGHTMHLENKHSQAAEDGDLPLSINELAYVIEHINDAKVIDATQYSNGEKIVRLAFEMEDGFVVLVEVASKSTHGLKMKTGWKNTAQKFEKKFGKIYQAPRNNEALDISNRMNTAESKSSSTVRDKSVLTYNVADSEEKSNIKGDGKKNFSLNVPVDSEGNKLSEGQQAFFADSKVRDEQDRLMRMYHGTPNGTFTVFKGGSYFTNMAWYADRYQNQGASSLGYKKTADNPRTYEAYLNITKPFDTRDPKIKKIWDDQYYHKWDTGEITDSGLPDWTSAEGLLEFIEENELDFDGLIIDEGGIPGDDGEVISRGLAWVPINGREQVKSVDNLNPTEDPDIRFSIDVTDPFFEAFEAIDEKVQLEEEEFLKLINERMDLDSEVSKKAISEVASKIKKQYNSSIKKENLARDLHSVFRYLKSTGNITMEDVMFVMKEIAKPILENIKPSDPVQEKLYNDFVNTVKTYKISLDQGQKAEVASAFNSYYDFLRMMKGKINLSSDGIPLDNIWTELCDISGGALSYGTVPNDQPIELERYIRTLNPTYQMLEGKDMDTAATDLALEIYRQFFVYQSMNDAAAKVKGEISRRSAEMRDAYKKHYSEAMKQVETERNLNMQRLAKEIESLTAEEQEAIRTGDTVNQALLENMRKDYQDRYEKLEKQKNEQIAKAKAQYQNSWINKNLRRERSELKNRVLKEVKALQNIIAHPSEGATKHVPVNLIKPTIEMLEAINLDNGGRNKTIAERLRKMSEVYESFKNNDAYSFDYDERIASDIKELQEMFNNRSYADLEIRELERVIEIVQALKTQIKNANNLILQGRLKDAQEAADSAMRAVKDSRRLDNAAMNALNRYANVHLNAYREFRKLSGYKDSALMDIYNDLDEGSKREMQIQKDLGAIFQNILEGQKNQKKVKKFISTKDEDLVDIGITDKNGKPIKITRAMRMSLIMHSMNSGNMRHILGSGITVPNIVSTRIA